MGHILKYKQKNKYVCIHEVIIRLIIMKKKMIMKNDHIDMTYVEIYVKTFTQI